MGIVGLFTRLWTYHVSYDDVLIVLPVVALFRLATRGSGANGNDVLAGVLLVASTIVMLTPQILRHEAPLLFTLTHTTVWIAMLVFLLTQAGVRPARAAAVHAAVP